MILPHPSFFLWRVGIPGSKGFNQERVEPCTASREGLLVVHVGDAVRPFQSLRLERFAKMSAADKGSAIRRWHVDFHQGGSATALEAVPIGFDDAVALAAERESGEAQGTLASKAKAEKEIALKEQKAWEFAQGTVKQIGMFAFMMYMSGNSVHIFSIMMTLAGLSQPFMAILNSGKAFERFSDPQGRVNVLAPRLLYCAIQGGGLAFGLYKLANIGLLPTHVSDWVSAMSVPDALEYSARMT